MGRHAAQTRVELSLPEIERRELLRSRQVAVGDVVGKTRVGVHRGEMAAFAARQEQRTDEEVLRVAARQTHAIAEGKLAIDRDRHRALDLRSLQLRVPATRSANCPSPISGKYARYIQ